MSDKNKEDVSEDEEEQYQYGRIIKDPTDGCLQRALDLYDDYDSMTQDEWVLSLSCPALKINDRKFLSILNNDIVLVHCTYC